MTQEPPPKGEGPVEIVDDAAVAAHPDGAVQSLKQAMRRARFDDAERAGVMAELRAARIGRLEMLQEALKPLIAQIPRDVDLFDVGLMPGVNPRLFVDMIGFVEMGRDARVYRFLQDTRHTRIKIAESDDIQVIVDAVTDYVARRLLERDKALASDALDASAAARGSKSAVAPVAVSTRAPDIARRPRRHRSPFRWVSIAFAFLIDLLGSIAFFTILAGLVWVLWSRLHG